MMHMLDYIIKVQAMCMDFLENEISYGKFC